MPNRRIPDHVKLLKGTFQPCRAQKPADPGLEPLPAPPRRLPPAVRRIWRELAQKGPHLRKSDQLIVEITANLIHQFRTDHNLQTARISLLMKCLGDMWMTPTTRHNIPPEPEPNPYDDF
jgi:hypothetical protein